MENKSRVGGDTDATITSPLSTNCSSDRLPTAEAAIEILRRNPTVPVPVAAPLFSISRETSYRWAREGLLPCVRSAAVLAMLEGEQ